MRIGPASIVCGLLLWTGCGSGAPIRVDDAWARPTAGPGPGVAYMSIINRGDRPDRLVGARSTRCATIEIHHTRIENGRMAMVPVEDGIAVDRGATVTLEPGGYHLMLLDPAEPLRAGEHFTVTLQLERFGDLPVEVTVRP